MGIWPSPGVPGQQLWRSDRPAPRRATHNCRPGSLGERDPVHLLTLEGGRRRAIGVVAAPQSAFARPRRWCDAGMPWHPRRPVPKERGPGCLAHISPRNGAWHRSQTTLACHPPARETRAPHFARVLRCEKFRCAKFRCGAGVPPALRWPCFPDSICDGIYVICVICGQSAMMRWLR